MPAIRLSRGVNTYRTIYKGHHNHGALVNVCLVAHQYFGALNVGTKRGVKSAVLRHPNPGNSLAMMAGAPNQWWYNTFIIFTTYS